MSNVKLKSHRTHTLKLDHKVRSCCIVLMPTQDVYALALLLVSVEHCNGIITCTARLWLKDMVESCDAN